jgi:hypothetical protein
MGWTALIHLGNQAPANVDARCPLRLQHISRSYSITEGPNARSEAGTPGDLELGTSLADHSTSLPACNKWDDIGACGVPGAS